MGKHHKISIGLLGSGVVGEAIQDIIFQDLGGKVGEDLDIEIRKIFTRDPRSKKWFGSRASLFTDQPYEVIDDPGVDLVIEALGFQKPSQLVSLKEYILRAFANGKPVVTSDKAVLAEYGDEIWAAAVKSGQALRFEACVGGGIPIIRSLSESFAVEEPEAVFGIVNGTCNYILSQMEKRSKPYRSALKEAQENGYAETNPAADVSGSDAEAKLLLLARVAFGLQLKPGTLWRKGIEDIHGIDFLYAARKGSGTIKHLAVAKRQGAAVQMFVSPALISHEHFLARIEGATNAICIKGRKSGGMAERDSDYVFVGPGAGGGPTAVAVLGDVCALARGERGFRSGIPGGTVGGAKLTAAR
ncbi:MAG TPA: homoserine dehydrogenase, partial [Terriglobales bacterium]|nr:homoserine dehydrogenase [Terriglobales bacterium]